MSSTEPIDVLRDHINRDYERQDDAQDWQKLPEIPTAAEILGPVEQSRAKFFVDNSDDVLKEGLPANLPHNIIDRPWNNAGDYIGAHYKLLREDAISPLRQAVSLYKSQPTMKDNQDLSIYTHVYIVGMTFSNLGPAPRIEFSYERAGKRIRWQQSKRLQQGTIVALSPIHDKFKTICKVAVIAARPLQGVEQNPPQIDLFWGDLNEADFDPLQEYVMIEAKSGYFEASRHMLVALQKLMTESFPLSDHLVHLNRSIGVPNFVEKQPLVNLNSLKPKQEIEDMSFNVDRILVDDDNVLDNVDILGPWPKVNGTTLDESQLTALRRIMTKKLAVVQGPPGTGKTFVSISALSVMLDNLHQVDPPIIVAAQTNHALDQLLRLIAPVEPNFLRLGGRTSEDNVVIKERTLYEVRRKTPTRGGTFRSNYKNAKGGLERSALEIQLDVQKALTQGDDEAGTLLELKIITRDQFDSLYDDDWISAQDPELPKGVIALWLSREQLAVPPRCPPINVAFGEEDDLEFEALEEAEVEIGKKDDDDIDTLGGRWFPFRELYTGITSPGYSNKKVQKLLDSKSNLWDISPMIRGEVYRYLRRQLKAKILKAFRGHMVDYHQHTRRVKVARWEADGYLIKKSKIKLIGCTTTGLSKYRGLLASLHPRTMLIEEAAETLEGTVLAAMFNSLQQLILVGDHQQLRAHSNIIALDEAPYNLAVSMFERLVSNGIEYTMLNKQRRMISEIRELLNPFYPNLQDHSSVLDRVKNRKPVPGMGGRDSYFFHHQWPESRDDFLSRFNVHEADMITAFFTYIVLNGIEPSQITVLTFYNGQRKILFQKLRRQPELAQFDSKFNIYTVDSYQGEENDVILLSLVRSNIHHNIGFLENKNRAVVSLSRARRGMYIFGNSINLLAANTQSFKLWSTITERLRFQKRLNIDSGLPIVCQTHQTETVIQEPGDWGPLSGGCRIKCEGKLPCGHPCIYLCHPFSHEDIICKEPCRIVLPCGHDCTDRCGDLCKCACDVVPPLKILTGQLKDELWQPSLDDVLGDSPIKISHVTQKTAPALLNTPGTSASNSVESSPKKWREWDAGNADKTFRKIQAANELPTSNATKNFPIIAETHRAVNIKNGTRAKVTNDGMVNDKASSSYCRPPPSRQPSKNMNGLAKAGKVNSDNKPADGQLAQPGTNFKYARAAVGMKVSPYRLKSPPTSPLQAISANLSTTIPPGHQLNQTVSTSPEMVFDRHYLEAVDKISPTVSLTQIIKKTALINIFPESIIGYSAESEEDLISFD